VAEKSHAAAAVKELVASKRSGSGVLRLLLPKPAALHPGACGLPAPDDHVGMGILRAPLFEVEAWQAMRDWARALGGDAAVLDLDPVPPDGDVGTPRRLGSPRL
jgi:hypothetical protein